MYRKSIKNCPRATLLRTHHALNKKYENIEIREIKQKRKKIRHRTNNFKAYTEQIKLHALIKLCFMNQRNLI